MKLTILEYDQESSLEGLLELDRLFKSGWETLHPMKYHKCCGIFRTVLCIA